MKSICIKTNNENQLNYLLNELEYIEIKPVIISTNKANTAAIANQIVTKLIVISSIITKTINITNHILATNIPP